GTVEVDHHHRVALARVRLGVPAIAPAVAEAALRAAVDQERDRIAATLLEARGLDHVNMDRRIVRALERELLVGPALDVGQVLCRSGPSPMATCSVSPLSMLLRVSAMVSPSTAKAETVPSATSSVTSPLPMSMRNSGYSPMLCAATYSDLPSAAGCRLLGERS